MILTIATVVGAGLLLGGVFCIGHVVGYYRAMEDFEGEIVAFLTDDGD